MKTASKYLRDMGEKEIIRTIIRPMLNPTGDRNSIGDDCAVIPVTPETAICASTDRVPADLVSFRLGIIDYEGLGYYLAVLNLSDIAAMAAEPDGLLLNLGLPADFHTEDFVALLRGANRACEEYQCQIVGGDLSSAGELSLSATSLGRTVGSYLLRRSGAKKGDFVYCTADLGLSATAFAYFLEAKPKGFILPIEDEEMLNDCFRRPRPRFDVGRAFREAGVRATAMDNTDGAAQSLSEIAESSEVRFQLYSEQFPIHPVSGKVAEFLGADVVDIVLGPGADFQLMGSIQSGVDASVLPPGFSLIGHVIDGSGLGLIGRDGTETSITPRGWNYYAPIEVAHTSSLSY